MVLKIIDPVLLHNIDRQLKHGRTVRLKDLKKIKASGQMSKSAWEFLFLSENMKGYY